jgi:glutathione S-transferase
MSMPILHGVSLSPFVRKVRVALAEKSVAYEHDPVLPFGQTDEYKAKSPLGKIPCWEDGDFVLPDSSCIIAYLERTHPEPALYPADPKECGRALWFEEFSDSKLSEVLSTVFFQRFVQPNFFQQDPDEALIAESLVAAEHWFEYLEGQLDGRSAIVGSHFSIADLAIGSIFVNFQYGGGQVDAGRWPGLAAYVAGLHVRPSFKAILEDEKSSLPQ